MWREPVIDFQAYLRLERRYRGCLVALNRDTGLPHTLQSRIASMIGLPTPDEILLHWIRTAYGGQYAKLGENEMKTLKTLRLAYQGGPKIQSLPAEIGRLRQLVKLNLYLNRLAVLPAGMFSRLERLTVLRVSHNRLVSPLPKEIGLLRQLQELYLECNCLTSLPEEIGRLQRLKELWLHTNQLRSLPETIGGLGSLYCLYLENNFISSLPREIGHLQGLVKLHLHHNEIVSLPKEIGHLKQLDTLDISHNKLASLPVMALSGLERLEILAIYDNEQLPLSSVSIPNMRFQGRLLCHTLADASSPPPYSSSSSGEDDGEDQA